MKCNSTTGLLQNLALDDTGARVRRPHPGLVYSDEVVERRS
jgi:hypothetical protein